MANLHRADVPGFLPAKIEIRKLHYSTDFSIECVARYQIECVKGV